MEDGWINVRSSSCIRRALFINHATWWRSRCHETRRGGTSSLLFFRKLERTLASMRVGAAASLRSTSADHSGPGLAPYIVSVMYIFVCYVLLKRYYPMRFRSWVSPLDSRTITRIEYPAWLIVLHTWGLCFKSLNDLPRHKSRGSTTFGDFVPHRGARVDTWSGVK